MPKVNGLDFLKLLRSKDAWYKTVPVFVLTVAHENEIHEDIKSDPNTRYFEKLQIRIEDLMKVIAEELKKL